MIARVTLEIALRKEFDYAIPPELAGQVDMGSRVQVPFGPRKVLGVVTAVAEESAHAKLKPILKVLGAQTLVTPQVLRLARWALGGVLSALLGVLTRGPSAFNILSVLLCTCAVLIPLLSLHYFSPHMTAQCRHRAGGVRGLLAACGGAGCWHAPAAAGRSAHWLQRCRSSR